MVAEAQPVNGTLIGQLFNLRHAAGVTRYLVQSRHRDAGYYECVALRGVEGTHHFVVFSAAVIVAAIKESN